MKKIASTLIFIAFINVAFTQLKTQLPKGIAFGQTVQDAKAKLSAQGVKEFKYETTEVENKSRQKFEVYKYSFMDYKDGVLELRFTYNQLTKAEYRRYEDFDFEKILATLRKLYGSEDVGKKEGADFEYIFWDNKVKIIFSGNAEKVDGLSKQFKIEFFYSDLRYNIIYNKLYANLKLNLPFGLKIGMDIKEGVALMKGKGTLNVEESSKSLNAANSEADFEYDDVVLEGYKGNMNIQYTYGKLTEIKYSTKEGTKHDYKTIYNNLKKVWGNDAKCEDLTYDKQRRCEWKKDAVELSFDGFTTAGKDDDKASFTIDYDANELGEVLHDMEDGLEDPRHFDESKNGTTPVANELEKTTTRNNNNSGFTTYTNFVDLAINIIADGKNNYSNISDPNYKLDNIESNCDQNKAIKLLYKNYPPLKYCAFSNWNYPVIRGYYKTNSEAETNIIFETFIKEFTASKLFTQYRSNYTNDRTDVYFNYNNKSDGFEYQIWLQRLSPSPSNQFDLRLGIEKKKIN